MSECNYCGTDEEHQETCLTQTDFDEKEELEWWLGYKQYHYAIVSLVASKKKVEDFLNKLKTFTADAPYAMGANCCKQRYSTS